MIGREGSRPVLLSAHLAEMKRIGLEWGFKRLNIICLIRRQDHWLASHYAQISDKKSRAGQDDFERLIGEVTSPRHSRYKFGMLLDYNVLYEQLANVSRTDNLVMLPYENLRESPDLFLQHLLLSLDTPYSKIDEICKKTPKRKPMFGLNKEPGIYVKKNCGLAEFRFQDG